MWLLDAHYDEGDRSCDHLFQPNAARLAWWTARRDAVAAAFVS
ncbi:hypothetical protein [Actinopolymorpha alba]|nr:hypothetical protein [Actinopolymorpha alba]